MLEIRADEISLRVEWQLRVVLCRQPSSGNSPFRVSRVLHPEAILLHACDQSSCVDRLAPSTRRSWTSASERRS